MRNIKVSEYLHFQDVDSEKGICAAWNRYYPSIFLLNPFARELLEAVKNNKEIEPDEETRAFFNQLARYKFIYDSDSDRSKEDFLWMIDQQLAAVNDRGESFYDSEEAYEGLGIYTDACNLRCGYCVDRYKRKFAPVSMDFPGKLRIIKHCLDRYMLRKRAKSPVPVKIFFSGGEILLEWNTIKEVVSYLLDEYKGVPFEFDMNTNLTLMSREIAEFLGRHHFRVDISIDGYREAHNRSRVYHNGSGSFDDVLKGLRILREFNVVNRFQGTIDYVDRFDPVQVYRMENYDFVEARLAPNLLDVPEEDAVRKAVLMGKFLDLNERHRLQVTELFFSNAKEKINQDPYWFSFFCRGLSCLPKIVLSLNISTLRLSQLCPYVPGSSLSLEEMEYDIYDKKLWETSYRFIKHRMEALKKYCLDCRLVGLCSGGCIYTGLDKENQVNKAACAFQKKLWSIYIDKIYHGRSVPGATAVPAQTEAAAKEG